MKKMKKLSAILLSLVMILATGITAFATTPADYSITVNNAKKGETFKAYKMLDLSVDNPEAPTAYRYSVNSAWAEFATYPEFTAVFSTDTLGNVTSSTATETTWSNSGPVSTLAEAAAKYVTEKNIQTDLTVTIAEDGVPGKINITEPGYYIVTSTMGSRAMIATTPAQNAVTINEKNDTNTVLKKVKEDDPGTDFDREKNTAQIGDTVEFKTEISLVPRTTNVKLHDTMDAGLEFKSSSVKVYAPNTDSGTSEILNATYYTLRSDGNQDSKDTFTIDFTKAFEDKYLSKIASQITVTVYYDAHLGKNAVSIAENGTVTAPVQRNVTYVSFGANQKSAEDYTETSTFSAPIFKFYYENGDTTKPTRLADAVFDLHKGAVGTHEDVDDTTRINLIKIDDNNYRVADETERGGTPTSYVEKAEDGTITLKTDPIANGTLVSDFKTVSTEDIYIWGLDSDSDYALYEIKAPEGYNKLTGETQLSFNSTNNSFAKAEIQNNTGAELPSTGGIGTTIFYIAGGALVLGAAVFFVVRRKMNKEESK